MKRLIFAVCILLAGEAFSGIVNMPNADTSIHNKVSVAALTARIDTVVFLPLRTGTTSVSDRQGQGRIVLTWLSKITNTSADSTPSFTLRPIEGGTPSNYILIPGIVDSLYGVPPAQTATWRGMTWRIAVVGDSFEVVVRNRMVAQVCSSSAFYRAIVGD